MAAYYSKNRSRIRKKQAEYYAANRDRIKRNTSEYAQKNKSEVKRKKRNHYLANRKRILSKQARWYKRNRKKVKERVLHRLYGLPPGNFEKMLLEQSGGCKICRSVFSKSIVPYVDHCHATGKVRGLLCRPCNTSLGGFKDSILLLENAIRYLTQN